MINGQNLLLKKERFLKQVAVEPIFLSKEERIPTKFSLVRKMNQLHTFHNVLYSLGTSLDSFVSRLFTLFLKVLVPMEIFN